MSIGVLAVVDRAAHELKSGRAVAVGDRFFFAAERLNDPALEEIASYQPKLIMPGNRAAALLKNEGHEPVAVDIKAKKFADIGSLIWGFAELAEYEKIEITPELEAAFSLCSFAEILPQLVEVQELSQDVSRETIKVSATQVNEYQTQLEEQLELVAETPLNLEDAEKARIQAFRPRNSSKEHLAIIVGDISGTQKPPLARVHSSCYTGDLLASVACDCGDQLRETIKLMNAEYKQNGGGGVILYLLQEGRGIGLINKLRTYDVQTKGLDTVEANEFFGFDDEQREFGTAVKILESLDISTVRLVTNNPKKVEELQNAGIDVPERVPMLVTHEHNHDYLVVKSEKSGHIID